MGSLTSFYRRVKIGIVDQAFVPKRYLSCGLFSNLHGIYLRLLKSDISSDIENSNSILQLSVGMSGRKRMDNLAYTFGFKAGIIRNASSRKSGNQSEDISQMDFHLGPILGAEYFFIPKLSLGAQIGFSYIIIGDENVETSPSTPPASSGSSVDRSILGNNAKIVLRWYY